MPSANEPQAQGSGTCDERWLAALVYEFLLGCPRRRTGLNRVEMERFFEIRQRLDREALDG